MATIRNPAMAVQFAGKVSKFEYIERGAIFIGRIDDLPQYCMKVADSPRP